MVYRPCTQLFLVSSEELARRMGLRVLDVRFADEMVMGQLYYNYGEAHLFDDKWKNLCPDNSNRNDSGQSR